MIADASRREERFVEIEGSPDLVVECVSKSSVPKDEKRLLRAYHRAGVREYWLVDARGESVVLRVHRHASGGYEPAAPDHDGFTPSAILGRSVRIVRLPARSGLYRYRLETR